jgi:hypothetical protein
MARRTRATAIPIPAILEEPQEEVPIDHIHDEALSTPPLPTRRAKGRAATVVDDEEAEIVVPPPPACRARGRAATVVDDEEAEVVVPPPPARRARGRAATVVDDEEAEIIVPPPPARKAQGRPATVTDDDEPEVEIQRPPVFKPRAGCRSADNKDGTGDGIFTHWFIRTGEGGNAAYCPVCK